MSTSTRRNITLTPAADALLDNVGNASAYLTRLVEQHHRAWQEALRYLLASGWQHVDVVAACSALNGVLVTLGFDVRDEVALSLDDSARLEGILQNSGASPDTWAERVASAQRDVSTARALVALAEEFWAGNLALHRALKLDP
jgi:hypothetical protein